MLQPLGTSAANFGHQSGEYNIELIIGDAVISNPFQFNIGAVTLKFPESSAGEGADKSTPYKQKPNVYTTKPEIKVIFYMLALIYKYIQYMSMLVSGRSYSIILPPPKHWQRSMSNQL